MRATLESLLPFLPLLLIVVDLVASGHAIVNKRDPRAAIGWVALIWLAPVVGPVLYLLLGINRIRRKALSMGRQRIRQRERLAEHVRSARDVERSLDSPGMGQLVDYVGKLVSHPLLAGNRVDPLVDGDQAFPAMLEAIESAERSVSLLTYIFDSDRAGRDFVEALGRAVDRGVHVRVLIDGVGARYTRPPITRSLNRRGVPTARFLPSTLPWHVRYYNLRSHRKVMVIDGATGFTGGMNIREGNIRGLDPPARHPIQDLHFRFQGPVVAQFQEVFAEDWAFATNEVLAGAAWFPALEACGDIAARGILDGPDENFEAMRMTLMGALAVANKRVRVVTPYFVPDQALITALGVTAMRGIDVDIVLPVRGNLRIVRWASAAILWQVLERGCRVWFQPEPFAHTKLMTVDGVWTLIGSSNWDARSHRLNFEFDVELYDQGLAGAADAEIDRIIERSRQTSLAEADGRPLWRRLRDGTARLLSPYL